MDKLTLHTLVLVLLIFFSGCEDSEPSDTAITPEEVSARFEVSVGVDNKSFTTRAEAEYETPGTEDESKIDNLFLFVVPLNTDGTENRNGASLLTAESLSGPVDGKYNAVFQSVITVGSKHLYLAANITEVQAGNLRNNWRYVLNSINNSEVVGPLTTNKIAMWAQVEADNGSGGTTQVIEITTNQPSLTGLKPVSMDRVVAKVLLTCKTDAEGYVALSSTTEGWMKLSDMRYALDRTAKAFYWTNPATAGGLQHSEGLTNIISYQNRDNAEWQTPVKTEPDPTGGYYGYTGGIYCLENPAGDDEADDEATQVVVSAKFIPRKIWVANGSGYELKEFTTIVDAIAAINAQKENGASQETYWCYQESDYYTYQAKELAQNTVGFPNPNSFSEYEGGYGYYLTYVNGSGASTNQWDREKSVVRRNTYYILKVSSISPPGNGQIDDVEFNKNIKLSTTIVDWVHKGGTSTELEYNDGKEPQN